jgi:hypothetical protein
MDYVRLGGAGQRGAVVESEAITRGKDDYDVSNSASSCRFKSGARNHLDLLLTG